MWPFFILIIILVSSHIMYVRYLFQLINKYHVIPRLIHIIVYSVIIISAILLIVLGYSMHY